MIEPLKRYLEPGYRYDFNQGPKEVRSPEDALRSGINCVSLAHLAIKDLFDYELPSELHCAEMYRDTEHFVAVDADEPLLQGDLFWFGIKNPKIQAEEFKPVYDHSGNLINWFENPIKHVAMYTGIKNGDNDPVLLSFNSRGGYKYTLAFISI